MSFCAGALVFLPVKEELKEREERGRGGQGFRVCLVTHDLWLSDRLWPTWHPLCVKNQCSYMGLENTPPDYLSWVLLSLSVILYYTTSCVLVTVSFPPHFSNLQLFFGISALLSSFVTEKLEANCFRELSVPSISWTHGLCLFLSSVWACCCHVGVASACVLNSLSSSAHKPCSLSCPFSWHQFLPPPIIPIIIPCAVISLIKLKILHLTLLFLLVTLPLLSSLCRKSPRSCLYSLSSIYPFHFSFKFTLSDLLAPWLRFNVGRKSI